MEFKTIPTTAQAVAKPNNVQPLQPPTITSATGIIVHKINKKIEQWSKTLKTNFAFSCVNE
jgi:hypothetical protein